MAFTPKLTTLPAPQIRLWDELGGTPAEFTLYGGTALALRLGHRTSVSFFGNLGLGQVEESELAEGVPVRVASLLDIGGTKVAVVQKRAEVKDYIDVDALLSAGLSMSMLLAAGKVVYGSRFNPLITLKALSYYGDLPSLPAEVRTRLSRAVASVDVGKLPVLSAYRAHTGEGTR